MWIQGCIWAGQKVGQPCNLAESFSEMLAGDTRLQSWYVAWWGMYVITCLMFMLLVSYYTIDVAYYTKQLLKQKEQRIKSRILVIHGTYIFLIIGYGLFTILKLVTLLLIVFFPVDQESTETDHYISAGLAFGSAIVCCILLCIRRNILTRTLKNINYPYLLLDLNILLIVGQIASGIVFVSIWDGRAEFTLAILLVFDTAFQIGDFAFDPHTLHRLSLVSTPNN